MGRLILSVSLLFLSVRLFKAQRSSKTIAALVSGIVLVFLTLSAVYLVSDHFTGMGIDESVVFHLQYGLRGAGFGEYTPLMIGVGIFLVLAVALSVAVFRFLSAGHKEGLLQVRVLAVALLVAAAGVNPANRDLLSLYSTAKASDVDDLEVPELYIVPSIESGSSVKNIVFIYLEGLERTYLDEAIFPGLTPNLRALEEDAYNFTDIRQNLGMGWTIGGITASQCGVPLFTPSSGNSMSGLDEFLPGARCMGDLLNAEGYRLEFMGGAPLEFAGKGKFFKTHGFSSIEGKDELLSRTPDPDYYSSWGLYDDALFALAKERLLSLSTSDDPFGLFLLNLDTHHPKGHVSAFCKDLKYSNGDNPILNAVHCTDRIIADFVDEIRQSPRAEDILLVLVSDHLAIRNSASEMLEQGRRRNLFIAVDFEADQAAENHRAATTLDIGATVLSMMGFHVEALGFGRNLLSDGKTLPERDQNVAEFLDRQRGFIAYMWNFPQLDKGLVIDARTGVVHLGERKVKFPALFVLDEAHRVKEIRFEFSSPRLLIDYVAEGSVDQMVIWIDDCAKVAALKVPFSPEEGTWCVAFGKLGGEELAVRAIGDSESVSPKEIARFGNSVAADSYLRQRLKGLNTIIRGGEVRFEDVTEGVIGDSQAEMGGIVTVQSSGGPGGSSLVETDHGDAGAYRQGVSLVRGVTLVGLNQDTPPVKLGHVDTCDPDNPVSDSVPLEGTFADVIERAGEGYGAFAIVVHDSAVCRNPGNYDMGPLFEGIGIEEWRELTLRQPYIAIIAGNGESHEFSGPTESSIRFEFRDFIAHSEGAAPRERAGRQAIDVGRLPNVAHAGGGYRGMTYTNSIDALDFNSRSYEFFEIDFSLTAEGHAVCLHDWEGDFRRSFGISTEAPIALAEFKRLVATRSDVEKCTLSSLVSWMKENPRAKIITDTKGNNPTLLTRIATDYPEMISRVVPQIYQPDEYELAKSLGYEAIIWTLYRYHGSSQDVLDLLEQMDLYALTMPRSRADQGLGLDAYLRAGVRSYVHTINDAEEAADYFDLGIAGIYTDWLGAEPEGPGT